MRISETASTAQIMALRDSLVHQIYGLVSDPNLWMDTADTLDALIACTQFDDRTHSLSEEITSLHPHLERVNLLLDEISHMNLQGKHNELILDHIPMGIILLDHQSNILQSNQRARVLLDHVNATYSNGLLRFNSSHHQQQLNTALQQLRQNDLQGVPFKIGDLNVWLTKYSGDKQGPLALYFGHSSLRRKVSLNALKTLYGLTAKEAQITRELCNGKASLDEAAAAINISISTARSHLKHVFSKTATNRQSELLTMVLTNPALIIQRKHQTEQVTDTTLQLAKLMSGRTVSYAEYGKPGGRPVLLCHAMTGSRLGLPSDHAILDKLGIRLIVPDRPGHGFSTASRGGVMHDWISDMRLFLPQIGASGCTVLAWSAGGPYGMQLAAELPEQIDSLCLVSCASPITDEAQLQSMLPLNRMIIHLARSNEAIAKSFIKLSLKTVARSLDSYHAQILEHLPVADHALLASSRIKQILTRSFEEASRQGLDSMINELIFIARDWQLDATTIRCPTIIWHGNDDAHVPVDSMKRYCQGFKASPTTHWVNGSGHYMLFSHWPQIISSL